MTIPVVLVLGILIGWLIEWGIDWFYWRRVKPGPMPDPSPVSDPGLAPILVPIPVPLPADPPREAAVPTVPARPDDLTAIKGIGPVISKRLNDAGIYTYERLAELTQDEFEQALGNLLERFINERSILRQARELAEKKKTDGR